MCCNRDDCPAFSYFGFCKSNGPLQTGAAAFNQPYDCPDYFWFDDYHPTTEGHQAMAPSILREMCGVPLSFVTKILPMTDIEKKLKP